MTLKRKVGPQYGAKRARTHRPPRARPYEEYRSCLRLETQYVCVYCLSSEVEVAPKSVYGGFEIDHFVPQAEQRNLRNYFENLMWACRACNGAKGNTWPSEAERQAGFVFLDPYAVDLQDHVRIVGHEVTAVGDSTAGQYTIDEVNLNSALHVMRRKTREEAMTRLTTLEQALAVLSASASAAQAPKVANVGTEIAALMATLEGAAPWDAPKACLCTTPLRRSKATRRKRTRAPAP